MSSLSKKVTDEERELLATVPVVKMIGDARAFVISCVKRGWIKYPFGTPLADDGGIKYVPILSTHERKTPINE